MTLVKRIFVTLGGPTAIARETGDPVQTVHSWKVKGNIPHWRRAAVIEAAKRLDKTLPPDLLAYLVSTESAAPESRAA
jgi:hypothetical protein